MKSNTSPLLLKIIFILAIAVLFFIGAITYKHLDLLNKNAQLVEKTYKISLEVQKLLSILKDAEVGQRGFIITHDEKFLEPYLGSRERLNNAYLNLKTQLKNDTIKLKKIQSLHGLIYRRLNRLEYNIYLASTGEKNIDLDVGKETMDSIRTKIDSIVSSEEQNLHFRQIQYKNINSNSPFIIYLTLLLTLGLLSFAYYRMSISFTELTETYEKLKISNEINSFGEEVGRFGNWQWTSQNNKLYFSNNLYRLLGVNPLSIEPSLDNFYSFVHPDDLDRVKQNTTSMTETGILPTIRYRLINSQGENLNVKAQGKSIHDKDGNTTIIGTIIDITDEVKMIQKQEKQNEELETKNNELIIVNESIALGEIIGKYGNWHWNTQNDSWYFSKNLFHILGEPTDSFLPTLENFYKYVHPEDLYFVKHNFEEMKYNQILHSMTYRIIQANSGNIINVKSVGRPITNTTDEKLVAGVTVDITDDFNRTLEIEEQNRILEANNKELQAFNYVASHDLQEPLRKIQTFISRLEDNELDNLSDSGKQYLSRIQSASKRMRILIDDLLQFSRTTRAEKVFEKTDLNDLLENSKLELAQLIEDKNAVITNDKFPSLKVIPFQIQQLFTNLINNSIKYAKANVNPEIVISVSKVSSDKEPFLQDIAKQKFCKITFTDNGIGFDQEYAQKIFELFSRLHSKDDYSGTGIGLAICKKIVENHKGFIFAKSEKGKGTTFTIYLPE
ncbi:PAS domain-containing protein [Flavobacterium sp. H122]|uniref:PAS domain-containing protein n=1 Tax=Flavobacterium sp. H122 TaxID=2529860 RepID=UPI0010AAE29E|nr:PAS domain-containing protein [Flavobacterium sp. H122]